MQKGDYLKEEIKHIDITKFDTTGLIEEYSKMAFQARNLARAAKIYNSMLADDDCSIILCLAGSLFSAGLKKIVYDMIENNMVDAIVSTGAIMIDQDVFESLGFKHYKGSPDMHDEALRKLNIDRIYDTLIDEDNLRECDMTIAKIADSLQPQPYSSREFMAEIGRYLDKNAKNRESVVLAAHRNNVPIFVPAFSDCSAGFGLAHHQWNAKEKKVSIDSVKDFLELTKLKIEAKETGIIIIGGGVPKNFTQDIVVSADILGKEVSMHKYAIQITVADERDGALSGSTLKESHSWGKVDMGNEQMVYGEATVLFPLLVSYAYHKKAWKDRKQRNFNKIF